MTKYLLLIWMISAAAPFLSAQPEIILSPIHPSESFREPTAITHSHSTSDRALYILHKRGRAYRYDLTDSSRTEILDLTNRVRASSEGGLLGMAFHPNVDSHYVYVNYTFDGTPSHDLITRISRFDYTAGDDRIVTDSERILLEVPQPAANHNAGDLAFGPDGYLYITMGDGGRSFDFFENGQDPGTLLGSMLRIDVDSVADGRNYAIPPDNPFANAIDTLAEIWALGLRNPWRISFDRELGDLYIADVGQGEHEEVNVQPAGGPGGQNYGWNCYEGFDRLEREADGRCDPSDTDRYTLPELTYPHSSAEDGVFGQSITGGYVYRGPFPDLVGSYVFGDFVNGRLFTYRDGQRRAYILPELRSISTFGEGPDGRLYVADYSSGRIFEITTEEPTSVRQPTVEALTLYPNPGREELTVTLPTNIQGRVHIRLIGSEGRTVATWRRSVQPDQGIHLSPPAGLPKGVYVLQLIAGDRVATGRWMVD